MQAFAGNCWNYATSGVPLHISAFGRPLDFPGRCARFVTIDRNAPIIDKIMSVAIKPISFLAQMFATVKIVENVYIALWIGEALTYVLPFPGMRTAWTVSRVAREALLLFCVANFRSFAKFLFETDMQCEERDCVKAFGGAAKFAAATVPYAEMNTAIENLRRDLQAPERGISVSFETGTFEEPVILFEVREKGKVAQTTLYYLLKRSEHQDKELPGWTHRRWISEVIEFHEEKPEAEEGNTVPHHREQVDPALLPIGDALAAVVRQLDYMDGKNQDQGLWRLQDWSFTYFAVLKQLREGTHPKYELIGAL
jgi:hypothetical protein